MFIFKEVKKSQHWKYLYALPLKICAFGNNHTLFKEKSILFFLFIKLTSHLTGSERSTVTICWDIKYVSLSIVFSLQ
jgi:hypothetical protein